MISVHVGENWASHTDANLHLTMYGSKGDSGKRTLYHNQSNQRGNQRGNQYERGVANTYELECVDLQTLDRIVLGHDGIGYGAGLFVNHVTILAGDSNYVYRFKCGKWLDDTVADCRIERTLEFTGMYI